MAVENSDYRVIDGWYGRSRLRERAFLRLGILVKAGRASMEVVRVVTEFLEVVLLAGALIPYCSAIFLHATYRRE